MFSKIRLLLVGALFGFGVQHTMPIAIVSRAVSTVSSPARGVLARVMDVSGQPALASGLWQLTKLLHNRIWNIADPQSWRGVQITTACIVVGWLLWKVFRPSSPPPPPGHQHRGLALALRVPLFGPLAGAVIRPWNWPWRKLIG